MTTITCGLCPRECHLKEGQRGFCFVRVNEGGKVVLSGYGRTSGIALDPIEKKPLYHYSPGEMILSLGTIGCNLGCKFCQNWSISRARDLSLLHQKASPKEVVALAKLNNVKMIAYTYNEPIVASEYVLDIATLAREQNIRSVAVSAGYISPGPREKFFSAMDATNIDLKAFSEAFYRDFVGGAHLQPVLDTLLYIKKETACWPEITNLLIPGANDSSSEIAKMCDWIVEKLGPTVPLHFSAFHPDWKLQDRARTPLATLTRAQEIAKKSGLHYVYLGNVASDHGGTTFCPNCQAAVIERQGYTITSWGIVGNKCKGCGHEISGHFEL
ncbi:MAG: AmmeMemoRadiSam system radical SAM enzyme [Oligoflexia bacterium]|nr:AmmeMemoRadiSam system radical SAM enzyme [Oligoflexia bacterium]